MTGPFETERQAEDSVRHILDSRSEPWRDGNRRLMEDACTAAGVELGAWDHRILLWLANYESSTCAVIAGLMTRVHQASAALTASQLATVLDALDVATDYKRDRAATCPDCESSLAELCGTCEWRLARADGSDALAGALQRHLGRASDRGDRPVAGDSTDETVARRRATGRTGRSGWFPVRSAG